MRLSVVYGIGFLLLVIALALFLVFLGDSDYPLIIHFDKYSGIDYWGSRADVVKVIVFGFIMNFVNLWLAYALRDRVLFKKEAEGPRRRGILPYFLGFTNLFLSILILIAVGVIISIN